MPNSLFVCDDCHPAETGTFCTAHGCGIEVQSFYDPEYVMREKSAVEEHSEILRNIPLRLLHGPFGDLCPGSLDAMVRDATRRRFDGAVEIAKALDIHHLILHHGYIPRTSPPDKWLERSAKFWRDFLNVQPSTFCLHLENHLDLDPELLSDVIATINDPRVDICLDIGHVNFASKVGLVAWIERLKTQIGYVHLHDNHGEKDEHLGLGHGTLPLVDVCHALRTHAPRAIWALEVGHVDLSESLEFLDRNGFI